MSDHLTNSVWRWKRYPEYRPADYAWVRKLPQHWRVKRLKFVADLQTGLTLGKDYAGRKVGTRPVPPQVRIWIAPPPHPTYHCGRSGGKPGPAPAFSRESRKRPTLPERDAVTCWQRGNLGCDSSASICNHCTCCVTTTPPSKSAVGGVAVSSSPIEPPLPGCNPGWERPSGRPGRLLRCAACAAQNGCWKPNQNCIGVFSLRHLAMSKRSTLRSTKPNQATSRRMPAPTAWAMGPSGLFWT